MAWYCRLTDSEAVRHAQALIDDDLMEPDRTTACRNGGHAIGDMPGATPIPDRAVLTGILFVLRSGIAVEHVATGDRLWLRHHVLAAPPALATSGRLEAAASPCCSTSCGAAANSIWPARSWTVPRSARVRGGKKLDRTLPIAARPGRSIMFSPTRTGFRSSRSLTAANRHDVTQLLPLVDAIPTAARAVPAGPCRKPGSSKGTAATIPSRTATSSSAAALPRNSPSAGAPHGSRLGRTRWVVERTLAWLHRFRRLAVRYERRAVYSRSVSHLSVLARVLVLSETGYLISQRALSTRWLLRPRRVHRSE